jgi:hypothetical protein
MVVSALADWLWYGVSDFTIHNVTVSPCRQASSETHCSHLHCKRAECRSHISLYRACKGTENCIWLIELLTHPGLIALRWMVHITTADKHICLSSRI